MVEAIMYIAIGILLGGLCALPFVPLIHGRAVRLAARRLELHMPMSLKEIRADKDLLRAEFAMATHRFEREIGELKARMAGGRAEIGRKDDEINRLRLELAEQSVTRWALESIHPGRDEKQPAGEEPAVTASRKSERSLAERLGELARLNPDLDTSPLVPHLDETGIATDRPAADRRRGQKVRVDGN